MNLCPEGEAVAANQILLQPCLCKNKKSLTARFYTHPCRRLHWCIRKIWFNRGVLRWSAELKCYCFWLTILSCLFIFVIFHGNAHKKIHGNKSLSLSLRIAQGSVANSIPSQLVVWGVLHMVIQSRCGHCWKSKHPRCCVHIHAVMSSDFWCTISYRTTSSVFRFRAYYIVLHGKRISTVEIQTFKLQSLHNNNIL